MLCVAITMESSKLENFLIRELSLLCNLQEQLCSYM